MSETEPVAVSTSRRVWQLAWPTIISNLLFSTVGFMYIKIAAPLGTSAVAAVTTGHRVFFLIQAILMGVSVATTALVARHWGASEPRQAEMVTWTALALAICLAVLLSIPALLFPELIAGLFGLDAMTTRLAGQFIFWLGLFSVFTAVSMMLSTSLRATGDVITPLWFLLWSSVLNVAAAYAFTQGFSFLPNMGVAGIAFGGGLAASTVTFSFVLFWWHGRFALKPIKKAVISLPVARQLVSIGLPSVLEQCFVQLAFLGFFAILARYGNAAYAAYGIGISLVSFSIVVGFAFGIATATLVGQQLGARKPELAVAAGWRGLRMAMTAMVLFSLIMGYYAQDLASFMIDDKETASLTRDFIYFISVCQPVMAIDFTLSGALRGAGDTKFPLVATVSGIMLGRMIPALIILFLGLGIYWIFAVMLFDTAIKSSLLLYRFQSRKWLHIRIAQPR